MRPFSQLLTATALVVLASGVACKNDSGVTGPTGLEGEYRGTMAGESSPSLSASLAVTVAPSATGTITPVGAAPITVTGTYVASTKAVTLSGGGYTIAGSIDDTGKLLGTYTHSATEGSVVAYQHATTHPVTVYCGTYTGDADAAYGATNAQLAVAAPRVPVTVTLPDTTCPRAGTGAGTLNTASNFSLVGSLASDCKAGNSCAALVTPT